MLRFLTAGESHGRALVAIVEGLPAGLPLNAQEINRQLRRRQAGHGRSMRQHIQADEVEILGGMAVGRTTGAPLAVRIANETWATGTDEESPRWTVPRPGHADLAGAIKYGLDNLRSVAERASARETAARVVVGSVTKELLGHFDIFVGSYVCEIGSVAADIPGLPYPELWASAEASPVRCPDPAASPEMVAAIDEAQRAGDSLGGVFCVVATGVPAGLGSYVHWDRRLDARLGQAMLSIPAVKGIEIGPAFANARRRGTLVHDCLYVESGRPVRQTNNAGGLEGGVTNGEPVVVRAAMKPIPTTLTGLPSMDLATGKQATTAYQRSDVCAVPAAAVVGEAMMAWVLANSLVEKLGGDSVEEMKQHWGACGAHAGH